MIRCTTRKRLVDAADAWFSSLFRTTKHRWIGWYGRKLVVKRNAVTGAWKSKTRVDGPRRTGKRMSFHPCGSCCLALKEANKLMNWKIIMKSNMNNLFGFGNFKRFPQQLANSSADLHNSPHYLKKSQKSDNISSNVNIVNTHFSPY